ncbi:MAG: SagB/ThcOx family dehydrogenase [Rikenellaceae bacterium]|nr:SagB/ThcOx family dehydrogenase [Rikenellaceae bacterium]MCL2692151.1 SagB/ThcOx family dehydrogenase [Rikenellaceae bacterium]
MNTKHKIALALFSMIFLAACGQATNQPEAENGTPDKQHSATFAPQLEQGEIIHLPQPRTDGAVSVEKALNNRRSHRHFQDRELSQDKLSQMLWAAYGITQPTPNRPASRGGLRTAPSAGALYPFELYVAVGKVAGIEPGVYRYIADGHKMVKVIDEDVRAALSAAALGQKMVEDAPASLIYTAIYSRMTERYGERGRERYVYIDLGHSAQNVYLQAEASGLGTCAVGAFTDDAVTEVMRLPQEEAPLYIMPIGYIN